MSRDSRDKAEAKERAKRATKYLEKFPKLKCLGDERFLDEKWQLEQLKSFDEKCAPQK